jgi:cytochrome bd-type quinol oxidase subunit 2
MIFFGILIGVVIMAAMIYMALDKKSNLQTRIASLAALALMIITVIICLFIILSDNTVPVDPSALVVGAPAEVSEENSLTALFVSIIFLLVLFAIIVILARREHKRKDMTKKSESVLSIR